MSCTTTYTGIQIGNSWFQYVAARLFAHDNNIRMTSPWSHPAYMTMLPDERGEIYGGKPIEFNNTHNPFDKKYATGRYALCGHWQRSEWYVPRRDEILKFCIPNIEPEARFDDIVMHVRMGDAHHGNWISPQWYLDILAQEKFNRLFIVTADPRPDFLSHFAKYAPMVICGDEVSDWNFLRCFDRIIISNSTYAWTAAFLSYASKIYTFARWQNQAMFHLPDIQNGIEVDGKMWCEESSWPFGRAV